MRRIPEFLRGLVDVRPGERLPTFLMSLYLMLVLFAYYILKPVSRALFLHTLDIDNLPWLYILIAAIGGVLAYFYSKVAVRFTLSHAVAGATVFSVSCLVILWVLLERENPPDWVLYAFNIWVSLFSIILVSQGWLVAANVFDARQAKRLYGILGVGAVFGAAFGGSFTAWAVRLIGASRLVLASAGMVLLAYAVFRLMAHEKRRELATARAAEEQEFSFRDVAGAIERHRHLQVIIGIIAITYVVDVMIEFQFSAMAKEAFRDKRELTAFLGNFYGLYLNLITFVLQFFLTAFVVSRFGVGGALQIMPVSIAVASPATFLFHGLPAAASARLAEASTRYSFNRTGMELLYLPLPLSLRNRTKAFVDIFADRLSRGIGGLILVLLTSIIGVRPRTVALVAFGLSIVWVALSHVARKEYIATVRKRLEMRGLDLENVRVSVRDPATLRLLEDTARGANARQAAYALSLLSEVRGYRIAPLLERLAQSEHAEVRAKVFEVTRQTRNPRLLDAALARIGSWRAGDSPPEAAPAVCYAMAVTPDQRALAARLLDHPNEAVVEGAIEALGANPDLAQDLLTHDWLATAARDPLPSRRRLAALAVGVRGDEGTGALHKLLEDPDPPVAAAACRAAGSLRRREYVDALIRRLADPPVRAAAIEALAACGERIIGTLGDLLGDEVVPLAIRRQIPRVLRLIPDQRSVDVLMRSLDHPNLALRSAVLRALNRLRENAPKLRYDGEPLTRLIFGEAHHYYELHAALAAFRAHMEAHSAAGLLAKTLEERLERTVERLFRLLGLRYPPKEIYAAYRAVQSRREQQLATAIEFLDNTLERDLKRFLLPLLDAPEHSRNGRDLFGIEEKDAEAAVRELIRSDDDWLVACSIAAAAELGLRAVTGDIRQVSRGAGAEVAPVAEAAVLALS